MSKCPCVMVSRIITVKAFALSMSMIAVFVPQQMFYSVLGDEKVFWDSVCLCFVLKTAVKCAAP